MSEIRNKERQTLVSILDRIDQVLKAPQPTIDTDMALDGLTKAYQRIKIASNIPEEGK